MKLTKEERRSTIILELEKCDKIFNQVELMLNLQSWDLVVDRLYLALYHAVCAMLINNHHDIYTRIDVLEVFFALFCKYRCFSPIRR